jgi:hypothetical protein
MCLADHFKNTTANEPCRSCMGNTFVSELGATACSSCSVFSPFSTANPSEGGVRCQCIAGYTQTELNLTTPACIACPADTFQPSQGQTTCELCDPNTRSQEASVTPYACLCNAGFFDDNLHQCQSCAGGTYKKAAADDDEDTTLCNACSNDSFSLPQSSRQTDCLCEPGICNTPGIPGATPSRILSTWQPLKLLNRSSSVTIPTGSHGLSNILSRLGTPLIQWTTFLRMSSVMTRCKRILSRRPLWRY